METQKISDLTTVQAVGLTDYIPVLTDETDNIVERIKVDNFVNAGYFTDRINEIVNNAITAHTIAKYNTDYPVGSIYIGTMSNCPIPVGTWNLVAQDRVLQGAGTRGNVGTTINESLPNITSEIAIHAPVDGLTGAAYAKSTKVTRVGGDQTHSQAIICLDNSRVSSTYQDNAPVQQNAYLVNIWERVA